MIDALVTKSDVLPPAEPMAGLTRFGARNLYARLPAQRAEHDRDLSLNFRKRPGLVGKNRIARGSTHQSMLGAANRFLKFEEVQHASSNHGAGYVEQRGLDISLVRE